ncbi:Gfo/Idh/MocA family protein [Sphingomonas sp. SRS2]|uniref:Gfo/Idh/MocA family protein n=1 Tax=Sphingomonas sp. SRS2 TaxID=133190 RepID=UPI0006184813|nr:Gfo/Idh/MocA family oxidoreductase [Sphingomonas sp. SRS2]KKC24650.1 hypothetical protein WP12_18310 [Sphingomonas sp. SRS2]
MSDLRIAIIGFGKIARDQHAPAIASNPAFQLVALVAPHGATDVGVPVFADHREMLENIELDAVAICTPPDIRYGIARDCLERGVHVLLEKPPCASLGEIADLAELSRRTERSLFTTWHAQFNDAVMEAARLIAREGLGSMRIAWLEDVEKWHPGQQWIWEPGGFGVFDAGINALSIATAICPARLLVRRAVFTMHRAGQQPTAVTLGMTASGVDGPIEAMLDWRHKGEEQWTIDIRTGAGTRLRLSDGGATLRIDDLPAVRHGRGEYPAIYERFAALARDRESLVDSEPLRLVADACLLARRDSI